ncbi:hypothetical protein EMIT0P265_10076 [Pseudomonas zeae]
MYNARVKVSLRRGAISLFKYRLPVEFYSIDKSRNKKWDDLFSIYFQKINQSFFICEAVIF